MSWDDGKHTKVKRVQLTFDDVINSIEVEYDGTNLKSQPRGTVGPKSDGFTLSPDEYVTEVTGYYKTVFSGDVITALTFKTNKKTYGPYGNKTRNYFSVDAPKDNQIAGFLGTSGNALNSIDVHFSPIPPASSTGNPGSNTGNPGSNTGIPGSNSGNPGSNTGNPGSNSGNPGSNTGIPGSNTGNPGSNGGNPGSNTGNPGSNTGKPGSNTGNPGSNTGNPGSNTDWNPQKLEAKGGKGGNQWDDGADHDGVTKIHVAAGGSGIEQIRFDYLKNGKPKEGSVHGVKGRAFISTIEINYPEEYLVSVKGWYDSSSVILGIQFKTNTKTSDLLGFKDGEEFTLEVQDKKIVGFHGFADSHLNSLGAYFSPVTSTTPLKPATTAKKLKAVGGEEGNFWDDGVFQGVRKVHVGQDKDGVSFVMVEYNNGNQTIIGDGHGKKSLLGVETFEVDYPSEYITAMRVYYDNVLGDKGGGVTVVTSLIFKTNKQTSAPFGLTGGEAVELKEEGHKIVGFHGKAGDYVHQIGVYVAPIAN